MVVRAKKYEAVTKFVKVMHRKLWFLFSGHGVISNCNGALPFPCGCTRACR